VHHAYAKHAEATVPALAVWETELAEKPATQQAAKVTDD
jgi:hypothetical protein